MQLIEQKASWVAPSCRQSHARRWNAPPEQLFPGNSRLIPGSCLPSMLETWGKGNLDRSAHQHFVGRHESWLWWANSQKISLSPEVKHTQSKDVLWLNVHHPARVKSQLATGDAQLVALASLPRSSRLSDVGTAGYARDVTVEACSKLCAKGELTEAVSALGLLVQSGSRVPVALFYSVLKGCLAVESLALGRRVHALAVKAGYQANAFLANHILRMYASHGSLQEARKVFSYVTVPNTHLWFSIISAHAELGEPKQAITLYQQMRLTPVKPNSYIFVATLKACAASADLKFGRQVHLDVLETGMPFDIFLASCLVDMYAKCSSLEDARGVFDNFPTRNVVTWNSLINGYADHGLAQEALALFSEMEMEGVIRANSVTFACLLKACTSVGALQQGKDLHAKIVERGLIGNIVIGNCLVIMYSKCGSLDDARVVFDDLPTRNVVTWNSMINGYAEHGLGQEALALYSKMEQEGMVLADNLIFACLLKACTSIGALQQGKQLHVQIQERGLEDDLIVGNCLVDMYGKCGSLKDASRVFVKMPRKNVITWTAMLHACGQCNEGQMAIMCFQDMLREGVQPDEVTFIRLLVACSHDGLVKEGRQYFKAMSENYGIAPTKQHFMCMVDLLGRSGLLDEAENILQTMPFESNSIGWKSLLNACRSYGDIERGRRCFESVIRLEPEHASAYVLMANIYADAGRCTDADMIESLRKSVGVCKKPAKAGIEVNRQVHTFVVGEDNDGMSLKFKSLSSRLKEGGHVPHTELVLKSVSVKEKEDELCGHAEKLALAYGLLNTPDGMTLLVTKNLRMCRDCHSATQVMSRIEKREIIVRDAHRVHRFVEGSCCCGNRP